MAFFSNDPSDSEIRVGVRSVHLPGTEIKTYKMAVMTVLYRFVYILIYYSATLLLISAVIPYILRGTNGQAVCGPNTCYQGKCKFESETNKTVCQCLPGWTGSQCKFCGGRIKLTSYEGFISDGYGNYSLNTKCSWLIEGQKGSKIQLEFLHFATECSWDHLYIYDGRSVFDKLIAVISGFVIPKDNTKNVSLPVITAHSGSAFLHFYSDAAYNMSGFNITYRMDPCPKNCSYHGNCNSGVCSCSPGWRGLSCDIPTCPNDCSQNGNCENDKCVCRNNYKGPDCSIPKTDGAWDEVDQVNRIAPRASHKAVVIGDNMWIASGDHFSQEPFQELAKYNFKTGIWETITPHDDEVWPSTRYGHSFVYYKNKLYMFGGLVKKIVENTLWEFDISVVNKTKNPWTILKPTINLASDLVAVVGHSAHVVAGGMMYVIFGHSPVYGYTNFIQIYDIENNKWNKVTETKGAVVKGGYGHSSVYDAEKGIIYVHGGHVSGSSSTYMLLDMLYSFEIKTNTWTLLRKSNQQRYLHSSVLLNDMILVFGGNVHNDTSISRGAKCYSSDFIAYDIKCNQWLILDPPTIDKATARFGHTAVVYDKKMYIFGGFRGIMQNDLLVYESGDCSAFTTKSDCIRAYPGTRCSYAGSECMTPKQSLNGKVINNVYQPLCGPGPSERETEELCESSYVKQSCPTCTENYYNCTWCGTHCRASHTCSTDHSSSKVGCSTGNSGRCEILHNCHACVLDKSFNCGWHPGDNKCYSFEDSSKNSPSHTNLASPHSKLCDPPCHEFTACENCTKHNCMWCSNQQRCVESNSYVASYPYGQCMEWATKSARCPATQCFELRTCADCLASPSCGWCDDGSNTGLGTCMEGGLSGPKRYNISAAGWLPDPDRCSGKTWNFITCPSCNCNGHSTCYNGTNECMACKDFTFGEKCELCIDGFFGNPVNGGNCTGCQCNSQADICDRHTGHCYCRTRGVTGQNCELCEDNYYGNPRNGGACYYDLTTDFQFTFKLTKKEDKHYTQIFFKNTPEKADSDVDFHINCSSEAYVNITVRSKSNPEERNLSYFECKTIKLKFSHREHSFTSDENTTFFVYVHDFKTPFTVKISFSQLPKIDLVHFFVTFFSCFLSLLLIAAIIWKVKNRYNLYMRRRMEFVQMEQRASRPFGKASIDVDNPFVSDKNSLLKPQNTQTDRRGSRRKRQLKKTVPSPIALEPLKGGKAAVVSLLLRLPMGDEDYTPNGSSGVTVGSTLVSVGNTSGRKSSIDRSEKSRKKHGAMAATPEPNFV